VEVDHPALARNVTALVAAVRPARTWLVVKADAYGHGAVEVATTALSAGAEGLCVAFTSEGARLREAGVAAPILVLSEQPPEAADAIVEYGLAATVYHAEAVADLAAAAERRGTIVDLHVKVDTGMHRVGVDPAAVPELVRVVSEHDSARLAGLSTHLACAEDPEMDATNDAQLSSFEAVLDALRTSGLEPPTIHVGNSAASIRGLHRQVGLGGASLVARVGIAAYGIGADPATDGFGGIAPALEPVLSLRARVAHVQRVAAGEGSSYGLRRRFERATTLATLPLGYADGVPRALWNDGEVLIGGSRRRFAGVVTMDQVVIDCGDDDVRIGDPVTLIGLQGAERVTANEWALHVGSIGYEIVCGLGLRLPRIHLR